MHERLKIIRAKYKMSQSEFAKALGIGQSTLAMMEVGKREISTRHIKSICAIFCVSEEWLKTGIGDMFAPKKSDTIDLLVSEYNLTQMERIVVEKFLELSHETRQGIIEYALSIASTVNSLQPTTTNNEKSERDQLHAELDRQLDMEKEAKEKSAVYFSTG